MNNYTTLAKVTSLKQSHEDITIGMPVGKFFNPLETSVALTEIGGDTLKIKSADDVRLGDEGTLAIYRLEPNVTYILTLRGFVINVFRYDLD